MTQYARETSVSREKSLMEIQQTLARYRASKFMYGYEDQGAMVAFEMCGRRIRFVLQLPSMEEDCFKFEKSRSRYNTYGPRRSSEAQRKHWEQACRQRWRALSLVIKAKLEAVESGITEFEDEFLAHIVLPDNSTVGAHARRAVAVAYETGVMPALLPLLPSSGADLEGGR